LAAVLAELATWPDHDQNEARSAMRVAEDWVMSQQFGQSASAELAAQFEEVTPLLYKLHQVVGLHRCVWSASAAAPLPPPLARQWAGLGIPLYDVYGMTETTASICSTSVEAFKVGTVGRAVPGVELLIAPDGELLVRGHMNTNGYHRNPAATAELLDDDGWLHTGDIAKIDGDGFVTILDRKKELIITSHGKNVAPSNVEALLRAEPVINQALVYADQQPYLVALLTVDLRVAAQLAELTEIPESVAASRALTQLVQLAVEQANSQLSAPEQVKRWQVVAQEWTPESGELTDTWKLRRRVIQERYAAEIAALYRGTH
jgi:long-chain acyl-CoA synthetase